MTGREAGTALGQRHIQRAETRAPVNMPKTAGVVFPKCGVLAHGMDAFHSLSGSNSTAFHTLNKTCLSLATAIRMAAALPLSNYFLSVTVESVSLSLCG